jgi:hypothetical protein
MPRADPAPHAGSRSRAQATARSTTGTGALRHRSWTPRIRPSFNVPCPPRIALGDRGGVHRPTRTRGLARVACSACRRWIRQLPSRVPTRASRGWCARAWFSPGRGLSTARASRRSASSGYPSFAIRTSTSALLGATGRKTDRRSGRAIGGAHDLVVAPPSCYASARRNCCRCWRCTRSSARARRTPSCSRIR